MNLLVVLVIMILCKWLLKLIFEVLMMSGVIRLIVGVWCSVLVLLIVRLCGVVVMVLVGLKLLVFEWLGSMMMRLVLIEENWLMM